MIQKDYYKKIKGLRCQHNLTQEQCANIINKSRITYQSKEKGEVPFTFDEVIMILNEIEEPITKLQ